MNSCAELFFDESASTETLHDRVKISETLINKGITRKDELIEYLRDELSDAFESKIGFWLQGSYKSHTLIKPFSKDSSFDIDVGVYVFLDEFESFDASEVKITMRCALESFCTINNECELQSPKNACEGLVYPNLLTIDTPIYGVVDGTIQLATNNGWVDSDPKQIQSWLVNKFSTDQERALMKRVVRYLKCWANVKWGGSQFKKIPSLAINVLVANNLQVKDNDEETFLHTAVKICDELESLFLVPSPLNGDNLVEMDEESQAYAHQMLDALKGVCIECVGEESETLKSIHYSNLFEHYFPQSQFNDSEVGNNGLPSLTTQPLISVEHYDKDNKLIQEGTGDSVTARKGESLKFKIENAACFNEHARIQWTVRNTGKQSNDANDIGHREITDISEKMCRGCSYTGHHFMECLISDQSGIAGVNKVSVRVRPALPTPKKKTKVFKGLRR